MKSQARGAEGCLLELPARDYPVPEGRVFTFPTRMADAYAPDCLEIVKPAFTVRLPRAQLALVRGRSSQLPTFGRLTWRRRLFMQVAPAQRLDGRWLVDLRYEADGNISHLVTFSAPLLLLARDRLGRSPLVVLRQNASRLAIAVFAALGFEVVRTDRDVEGEFLVGSTGHDRVYEPYYRELFERIAVDPAVERYERLYIARRDRRRLENEEEIHGFLARAGFRRLYFEDYTIPQQWAYARHAEVIVALHGAALSSLVFNRGGVKVVEMYHPGFAVDFFRRITSLVSGSWCGVYGRIPADLVRRMDEADDPTPYLFSPTRVSQQSLERALAHLGVDVSPQGSASHA